MKGMDMKMMSNIDYLHRLDMALAAGMDPGDDLHDIEILRKTQELLGPDWHDKIQRHIQDLQEAAFAAAFDAGLPVFERGGIVALAQADVAIAAARR